MKISFEFDPKTKKVSNVVVEGLDLEEKVAKTSRAKKAAPAPIENPKVTLNNTSLKLNQDVLDQLGVKVGDRLLVNFTKEQPVLVTPEQAGLEKGGNLITKSLTVSCKGKTSEMLAAFGSEFDYKLDGEGFLLLTNEQVEAHKAEMEAKEMHLDLLDETDFTTTVEDGVEIDFSIEL